MTIRKLSIKDYLYMKDDISKQIKKQYDKGCSTLRGAFRLCDGKYLELLITYEDGEFFVSSLLWNVEHPLSTIGSFKSFNDALTVGVFNFLKRFGSEYKRFFL